MELLKNIETLTSVCSIKLLNQNKFRINTTEVDNQSKISSGCEKKLILHLIFFVKTHDTHIHVQSLQREKKREKTNTSLSFYLILTSLLHSSHGVMAK